MMMDLYPKLALTSIKKNKKIYLPYILTAMGMVFMFYIIHFIATDPSIKELDNGWQFQFFLSFGTVVVGLFVFIFLFYTNSFLVRRRKKEFGLYNILGMGKGNLSKILFWETVIIAGIAIVGGVLIGVLFSRGIQLLISRFLGEDKIIPFAIYPDQIKNTAFVFAILFLIILLYGIRQIYRSSPIELLHSETVGEKPPKAKWFLAALGVVLLVIGYALSITLKAPFTMETLLKMTSAIILVIIATYILFIAGSVALCKILQKNKNYYYKTNHFISVSSMLYRMKRNGAGLATICVLSIMVLVILSTTVCLYVGQEDGLHKMYPRDIIINITSTEHNTTLDENYNQKIHQGVEQVLKDGGVEKNNILDYRFTEVAAGLANKTVALDYDSGLIGFENTAQVYFISLDDYNRIMGTNEQLADKEVLLHTQKIDYLYDTLTVNDYGTFDIVKKVPQMIENGQGYISVFPYLYVVVSPQEKLLIDQYLIENSKTQRIVWNMHDYYGFDTALNDEQQIKLEETIKNVVESIQNGEAKNYPVKIDGVASSRQQIFGLYGGILVLGVFLSIVFLMAAVLTMYYKQVTEGYEDQQRYEIMQKVGMTQKEIKKTINSQVLTVFFLPLAVAGIHLIAAFNMIKILLEVIGLSNTPLLIQVTIISFLVFTLFYALMYKVTSKAYYSIVSGNGR